jgi:hypothetical protein
VLKKLVENSRESAIQERKNLETENPVVNRSKDSGFDYTQSKKDIKKRYKKMDEASAPGIATIPHGTVSRFQGSTRPLGDTKAMNAMMKKTIETGLAADLGTKLAKAASPLRSVNKLPSMSAPKIKKDFTPSVRTMELREAHDMPAVGEMVKTSLGSGPTPIKMRNSKPGNPKVMEMHNDRVKSKARKAVVDDMGNKGRKGKGPKKMAKKRTIKAKF